MKSLYLQTSYIFPFGKISFGKSIVIYGAGKIGRCYLNQIMTTKYVNIKYMVDKDYEKINLDCDIQVCSPEVLRKEKNSIIVIAVASEYVKKEIINKLNSYGIPKERIIDETRQYCYERAQMPGGKRLYLSLDEYNDVCDNKIKIIKRLLKLKKIKHIQLRRIGRIGDGGYVMVDDFEQGRVAYSFGISNEVSWDFEIADNGYEVFMYDHTISGLPCYNDRFHWFPIGITGRGTRDERLKTLEELIEINGHKEKKGMLLKMDVEGAEWDVLSSTESHILQQYDQMVFEFHDIYEVNNFDVIQSVLKKINKTHQLIHIHANNYGDCIYIGDKAYPSTVEVTYVIKGKYEFACADDVCLPISEDSPNADCIPEIILGYWNNDWGESSRGE